MTFVRNAASVSAGVYIYLASESFMKTSQEELFGILDKLHGLPVLVVGDVMLDRYYWGNADRLSPEAPVPILNVKQIENRLGGAGNVVRNLINLGCKVSLVGLIGDDEEGRELTREIEKFGVNRDGLVIDRERPTTLKMRVVAQRQQIVRVDREIAKPPSAAIQEGLAGVVESHLRDHKAVIISDYAKGAVGVPLLRRLSDARVQGRISVNKCPLVCDPHPKNYHLYTDLLIVKPNRKEAEQSVGFELNDEEAVERACKMLIDKWQAEIAMITLGEKGMAIYQKGQSKANFFDTIAQEVFDVSGAGDTVTAVFTAALAAGASPLAAAELSNMAGGIVVGELGTAPINVEKLKDEIDLYSDIKLVLKGRSK